MSWISRRRILGATALGIVSTSAHHIWAGEAGNNSQTDTTEKRTEAKPLALGNYQPRSMLHLPETHVRGRAFRSLISIPMSPARQRL
jgi:hypothetical protein